MEELRQVGSLLRQNTPGDYLEGVPGRNVAPLLITPVILGLKEVTVNIDTTFCAQSTGIRSGDGLVPIECL